MSLINNLKNRNWLLEKLKAEIVGPDPAENGIVLDLESSDTINLTKEQFYSAKKQKNGDEILWQDSPIKRYGAGILFPTEITPEIQLADEANSILIDQDGDENALDNEVDEKIESQVSESAFSSNASADDTENYDVTLANAYRPSAMGISFLADLSNDNDALLIKTAFSEYKKKNVIIDKDPHYRRNLWQRKEISREDGSCIEIEITFNEILSSALPIKKWVPGFENKLEVMVVARNVDAQHEQRLITASVVNRQRRDEGNIDELCFFQCGIEILNKSGEDWIQPYPEVQRENKKHDDEEEIARLLYRDRQTFAIGHGCAASWNGERPKIVNRVWTETVPTFETPSTSADLLDKTGESLRVSMRKLAGLDSGDNGENELARLVNAYKEWIEDLKDLKNRVTFDGRNLPVSDDLTDTASLLIKRCENCLQRINNGIEYLNSSSQEGKWAKEAFKLTNQAMLIAQLRSSRDVRNPVWKDGRLQWDKAINNPDPSVKDEHKGYWRPFQIAFLLMSIKGICDPGDLERNIVDLIWFPTGGGKTEAYLGLTAFTIFYNRLSGKNVAGADVLMRYTLRLLTTQQFQRAGLLFCAMEHIRKKVEYKGLLGDKPFRLGMWVGGDASPNLRSHAKTALKKLQRNPDAVNPFVLLKCPWCNAKFGPKEQKTDKGTISVYGYHKWKKSGCKETVAFRCNDHNCEFGFSPLKPKNDPLPVLIIDEDIIDNPPNMVIGTVDKFALLSWKPEIRSLFGVGDDGRHEGYPPSLIIQDELHLISGPLGSMVGAYETVVDELCTAEIGGKRISPKIVASTATISRAEDQVKALYARDKMMLLPLLV